MPGVTAITWSFLIYDAHALSVNSDSNIEAASRRAELRQADMAPGANALVNRAHDLFGVVFQELLDTLRIHSRNIKVRRMVNVNRAHAGRVRGPRYQPLCPWGNPGRDDHFAAMGLDDHVARQAPGTHRETARDGKHGCLAGQQRGQPPLAQGRAREIRRCPRTSLPPRP